MKHRKATQKKTEVQPTTSPKPIHKRTPSNAPTASKPISKKQKVNECSTPSSLKRANSSTQSYKADSKSSVKSKDTPS